MPWASMERVIELYVFDRELRLVCIDAIERIEVAFRCKITFEYSFSHGNNWYEDNSIYLREYSKTMKVVQHEIDDSKELFIQHYKKKYTNPKNPPSWMVTEILSFGQLSRLYKNLITTDAKKRVAEYFSVTVPVLESWIEHLVYIRNICAHHSRLWNRIMTVSATIPTNPKKLWISLPPSQPDKIYTSLCIMAYMLERSSNKPPLTGKLKSLMNRFPNIDTHAAGFNKEWKTDPFWKGMHISITHRIRIVFFKCKHSLSLKFKVK